MKFDRNKDGGEDEEDRVPAAEAARRRFFPPPGKTMMNEENALKTFREGGEGLGFGAHATNASAYLFKLSCEESVVLIISDANAW